MPSDPETVLSTNTATQIVLVLVAGLIGFAANYFLDRISVGVNRDDV